MDVGFVVAHPWRVPTGALFVLEDRAKAAKLRMDVVLTMVEYAEVQLVVCGQGKDLDRLRAFIALVAYAKGFVGLCKRAGQRADDVTQSRVLNCVLDIVVSTDSEGLVH